MARNYGFWHSICTIYTIESKFINERENKMKFTKSQKAAMKRFAAASPNFNRVKKLSPQQVRVQQGAVSRSHYL